ncbi:aldo/keto reductase [Deinococcus radiotolerans]|uniref:Glyceraldehyde 3-phosphate reductase n=1 Tax=Deinococcus radiotolerans TaxID=1309407 RepID=A0ABQ2FPS3_9DEIO|nr:aldo/keto reductase [Deinococcus radiotolerans]GGL14753.1 glyceraldehyde 3-phosphate reductase [Deinococcus radiotolerans]
MTFPDPDRYARLPYRRAGRSGLQLPVVSLGLWHNFGGVDRLETMREMLRTAFDGGVTHFDLANNYGPPPGSAESNLGQLLRQDFAPYRDELIISTKAGYTMWPGPYGDWGSRKYLLSSLDASLRRLGLPYVDVFYHHRPDPNTPLEETMGALDHAVRSGRALYVGLSNYPADLTRQAAQILRALGTPCVLHQPKYSLFERGVEGGLLDAARDEGIGVIAFSPLAQGLLTGKYLGGIPGDSRAAGGGFLKPEHVTEERLTRVRALNDLAAARGQTLAQLALAWVLRHPEMTSALIGASRPAQITDALGALNAGPLRADELDRIEVILRGEAAP